MHPQDTREMTSRPQRKASKAKRRMISNPAVPGSSPGGRANQGGVKAATKGVSGKNRAVAHEGLGPQFDRDVSPDVSPRLCPTSWVFRFWAKVDRQPDVQGTGCWLWVASLGTHKYGSFGVPKKDGTFRITVAHRVAWELSGRGKLPTPGDRSQHIDHLCSNRQCCNPDHLELVSRRENILRGRGATAMVARKGFCDRPGHQVVDGKCLSCREQIRRSKAAARAAAARCPNCDRKLYGTNIRRCSDGGTQCRGCGSKRSAR